MSAPKLRNIGPKSAAWLRQVGLRTQEDLAAAESAIAELPAPRGRPAPGPVTTTLMSSGGADDGE
jgi:hypothetical protein